MNKTQFATTLAEKSCLNKKQAAALAAINAIVAQQLGKRGPGELPIPGPLELGVVDKPATSQHEGTPSPGSR